MGSTAAASCSTLSSCDPTWVCTPSSRNTALRSMRAIASRASSGSRPNLEPAWPGRLRRVGGGLDAGDDPHQAVLLAALRHDAFQPVDVVEVVDDHQADAVLDGELELFVGLGVAVHDQPGGIGARLDGGEDLAAARDVEVKALFDHHPLNGGAREGLRREGEVAAGPAAAERVEVLACPVPKRVFGDDDRRAFRTRPPPRRAGIRRRRGCRRRRFSTPAGRGPADHRRSAR